jgi:hypothetical protein
MLVLRDVFGIGRIGSVFQNDLDLGQLKEALPPSPNGPWSPPPELHGLPRAELLEMIRGRSEYFFIKTHRLSEARDPAPAIYIVRDGRDALVSQAHFVEHRERFADHSFDARVARLIREGMPNRSHWSENVRVWRTRPAPTALIRFEDLVVDPVSTVSSAFETLDLPLRGTTGRLPSFAESRAQMPHIFRRGEVGAWREEMPPHLEERFWRLHGDEMRALGYRR